MKKSYKITIISSLTAILLVAAAYISYPYIFKQSPIQSADSTSSTASSAPAAPSSETTSNEVSSAIVVPEIEAPVSSESPAASSAPAEIKVEGSPTSKPVTSKPTSKPNNTSSKPTAANKPAVQASSAPAAAPTGNGDVYDERTGTYPKIGDTMVSPKTGSTLIWVANKPSGGPGWVAEDDGGKSGNSAGLDEDFMQDLYDKGYTGNDIGAD